MKTISFSDISLPKSKVPLMADVVFIHTSSYSSVTDFLRNFPEFVQFGENRVIQHLYDPVKKEITEFLTDDISTYTLAKRQYVAGSRLTNVEPDTTASQPVNPECGAG